MTYSYVSRRFLTQTIHLAQKLLNDYCMCKYSYDVERILCESIGPFTDTHVSDRENDNHLVVRYKYS